MSREEKKIPAGPPGGPPTETGLDLVPYPHKMKQVVCNVFDQSLASMGYTHINRTFTNYGDRILVDWKDGIGEVHYTESHSAMTVGSDINQRVTRHVRQVVIPPGAVAINGLRLRDIVAQLIKGNLQRPVELEFTEKLEWGFATATPVTQIIAEMSPLWSRGGVIYTSSEIQGMILPGLHNRLASSKTTSINGITVYGVPDWFEDMVRYGDQHRLRALYERLTA